MTDDDIRESLRSLKELLSRSFETIDLRLGHIEARLGQLLESSDDPTAALTRRVNEVESGFVNVTRDLSNRISRLEDRE